MSIFKNLSQKKNKKKKINEEKINNVTYPILPSIEPSTPEKNKVDGEEEFLLNYINNIKNNKKIREMFPEIINKLEEDLSKEEKEKLIKPIQNYEIEEMNRRNVFYYLACEYNNSINRKVEENYDTGKIEEFPLCKRIGTYEYEELKALYPEDMLYLEKIYLPIYREYMKEAKPFITKDVVFSDLTEFAKFIEKINYYEGTKISDKYFNIVNDALDTYGKEMYGNKLFGTVKYYSFIYDNYLKVKSNIMGEIEILMSESLNDEKKRETAINIKNKCILYLSIREGEYIV